MRLPLVTLILFFIQISQAQTYTYQSLINTDASWHSRCQSGGINMTATWYNNVYFKGIVKNIIMWMFARAMIAKGFLE